MAISIVGTSTSASSASSTSLTVVNSNGTTGDLMVLFVYRRDRSGGDAGVPSGLSGWTNICDTASASAVGRLGVWYKSWASGDVALTSLGSTVYHAAGLVVVRGATTTGITAASEVTGTGTLANGALTAAAGDLLLSAVGAFGSYGAVPGSWTVTRPSGMTSQVDEYVTTGVEVDTGVYNGIRIGVDSLVPGAGSTGTKTWTINDNTYNIAALTGRNILIPVAGETTHNADAAVSTTAAITATATRTQAADAAVSTAVTISASATRTAFPAAAVATTATLAAAAALAAAADAAVSTASAISATMTVTPAGTYADASLSTTATLTATVNGTRPVDVAMSATSAIAATATVTTTHSGAAALSVVAAIAASMTIEGEAPTTVGYMRGVEMSSATMRNPATNASDHPTLAALVSIDTATLTAVTSTSVTPSRYGVSVFVGGSVDPITAELLPAGSAYVWFASDGIHVQEAS